MSDRQLVCTLLDLRTVKCAHLNKEQRHRAVECFLKAYATFTVNAWKFQKEKDRMAREEAERAHLAKKVIQMEASVPRPKKLRIGGAPTGDGSKNRLESGTVYGESNWTDDDGDDTSDPDGAAAQSARTPARAHRGRHTGTIGSGSHPLLKELAKTSCRLEGGIPGGTRAR